MKTLTLINAARIARDRQLYYDRLSTAYAHAGDHYIHEMLEAHAQWEKYLNLERRFTAKYKQQLVKLDV